MRRVFYRCVLCHSKWPAGILSTRTYLAAGSLVKAFKMVHRSKVEHLIVCNDFDSRLSDSITKVLRAIHWSTLRSPVLSGDNINEWIQILKYCSSTKTACSLWSRQYTTGTPTIERSIYPSPGPRERTEGAEVREYPTAEQMWVPCQNHKTFSTADT